MTEVSLPDQEAEKTEKPLELTVEELVNEISHAGPGSSGQVVVRFPDGSSRQGRTVWATELAGQGPAVVFDDPEKPGSYEGVLPLGGQTIYVKLPRTSSMGDKRGYSLAGMTGSKATTMRMSYDPVAEKCRFEIIPKQKPQEGPGRT